MGVASRHLTDAKAMNPYRAPTSPPADSFPSAKLGVKEILFSFRGRIPRRAYWYLLLSSAFVALVLFALLQPLLITAALRADMPTVHEPRITPLGMIVLPALLFLLTWINLALGVKRYHDHGKSGWWMMIGTIPIVGGIWMLVESGFLRGTVGPNAYGSDPT